jgi:S-adenosylmethionine-diacylglycerol 3-amino-3-carboxypropyl transferase
MALRTNTLRDSIDQKIFNAVCSRSLVYNACWEDPAVDRKALRIQPDDRMLVITSAGCNVLDYALLGPERIFAVDANPRQSALLELKIAGIRHLEFEDFFALFGQGHHANFRSLYQKALRPHLGEFARGYWDERGHWFGGRDRGTGFYYYGLSGCVARGFRGYLGLRNALRGAIGALLEAKDLEEQRRIYDREVQSLLWTRDVNWILSRQSTMTMLGVPHPQRKEVQRQHTGGVAGFVREAIEYVFRSLPVRTNYFWTLYLRGHYLPECCPEYLRPANFTALKKGLVNSIDVHTSTVTDFLKSGDHQVSKFVLLDHMDWMSSFHPEALQEEWYAIVASAAPGARIIFRSAHRHPGYLEQVRIGHRPLLEALRFHDGLALALEPLDRVHTYAGFHIADMPA